MKHDVIIMGAGPNGLATALALGGNRLPRPLRVLVLDGRDPHAVTNDSRGTALTQSTQAMFKTLGLWDQVAPHTAEMRDVIVTDGTGCQSNRPALLTFHTDANMSAACIVENGSLNRVLLEAVKASPHITLQGDFPFDAVVVEAGFLTVQSQMGATFRAALLVAADGRQSHVRNHLGIAVDKHDYEQVALAFSIMHELPHGNIAEEHFAGDGVFAVLPLPGHACSIVWGMAPHAAQRLMALDDNAFERELQDHMGGRLGRVALRGKRGSFPLVMQIAREFVAPRSILLGDAAHAIHPLAGLGLNLGFKDAAALADILAQAKARGEDIGSASVLDRYQVARRFDTLATARAMDGMNALFVNDDPLLKVIRSTGLRLIDQLPWAKAALMQQAANLSQNNPRLLRGLLPG